VEIPFFKGYFWIYVNLLTGASSDYKGNASQINKPKFIGIKRNKPKWFIRYHLMF